MVDRRKEIVIRTFVLNRSRKYYKILDLFNKKMRQLRLHYHHQRMAIILELQESLLKAYIPRNRTIWSLERSDVNWLLLQNRGPVQFKEAFRVSKELFNEICELLQAELQPMENPISRRETVSACKQVAICLYKLASCAEYRVIGDVFGVHKSTVHKCFYNVINAINKVLLWNEIKMPDANETRHISLQFEDACGIPQIIGCIGGSHIPILAPAEGSKDFINRKQWPSIVLQAVVDNLFIFRDISCKFPGSCHDSAVLKGSYLYKNIENLIPKDDKIINGVAVPYFLIGDPAYELLPWLMKDYPGRGISMEKELYNEALNSARVTVEIAFGRLKGRWRMLLKRSDINYTFMPNVVAASCCLHNMIEKRKEPFPRHWLQEADHYNELFPQPNVEIANSYDSYSGSRIRDALCDFLNN